MKTTDKSRSLPKISRQPDSHLGALVGAVQTDSYDRFCSNPEFWAKKTGGLHSPPVITPD
jgi:hypothetical protein